ncbi:NAD-dependent epimerase/dehydratase family protein [Azospirillum halopraeferens]|uniref:NAD-dependent epimerase/dehydratase family protein n=1 Tax=Azospirillum halopraeferens TaxID=34010 RepID=UPI0003FDFF5F|nr:SDR family oxidoreductase [Azospirillum halopraeferens]
MAQILLTGGSGYLGACVADALARRGLPFAGLPGRLEAVAPHSLRADVVIHAAGALRHRMDEADRSNRAGMAALIAGLDRPTPVVFVSSRSVYGPHGGDRPLTESDPVGPIDAYGRSKLEAERRLAASGHPFVIVRATTLIGRGPGGAGRSFLTAAARTWIAGGTVTQYTPDRPHDHLDVRTLADALVRIAAAPGAIDGRIVNAAGPIRSVHATMDALAAAVRQHCGRAPALRRCPEPAPPAPLLDGGAFARLCGPPEPPDDRVLCADLVAFLAAQTARPG